MTRMTFALKWPGGEARFDAHSPADLLLWLLDYLSGAAGHHRGACSLAVVPCWWNREEKPLATFDGGTAPEELDELCGQWWQLAERAVKLPFGISTGGYL